MPTDVESYRRHVEDFLTQTEEARFMSQRARDYVDNRQWTKEEEAKLRARNQAPIVVNRIKPKIEGLKGLLIQRNTDPKAYPRTQKHEDAAHAITDALRYVADATDFDDTKMEVADDFFVEGYGGVIVEVRRHGDDVHIEVNQVPWDRIYYDPHSRRHDFADARYVGVVIWMDRDVARESFGKVVDEIVADTGEGETFDDRPRWIESDKRRGRIRVAQEFSLYDGAWQTAVFCAGTFLVEPRPSPYLDEDGEPCNPIELVSAHIDRDNRRFGEVEYWIDLQDEINHRRSKALHLLSSRQTAGRKGAIADVASLKRELAKPDGHVEYEGEKGDFEVIQTGDMASAQFSLLEEAKGEIDAVGFNAQLAGERQGSLSGRAILALQAGGSNELANMFGRLNHWEKRVYRQIWYRVRQFWDQERWIRVTDDDKNLRWVGFNVEQTLQVRLEETIKDESLPEFERKQAAKIFMEMMQSQDPRLQEPVMLQNPIAELDVDIILEQSFDTVNVQAEQFEILAQLGASRPEVPFTTLLRLSSFRDKEELIEKIESGMQEAMQRDQQAAQLAAQQERASMELELEKDSQLQQQKIQSAEKIKAAELSVEREKYHLNKSLSDSDGSSMQLLVDALKQPRSVQYDDDGRVVGLS